MSKPLVIILMGSKADAGYAQKVAETLTAFGVESVTRVASAHKSVHHLLAVLEEYEADERPKVYVTIAGRSNALSGMVDANVAAPVIACPPLADAFGGADVFSSLHMPGGVAPLVVLDPANAALAAVKILALGDSGLRDRVEAYQAKLRENIIADDAVTARTIGPQGR